MGTLYQLLALPACFLLLGLLRGDCGHLFTALLRRLAVLTGADDAARFELMKTCFSGAVCGFVDSAPYGDVAAARKKGRRKGAATGAAADVRSPGAGDAVVAGSGIGTKWRPSVSRGVAMRSSGIAGNGPRDRRFALRSVIGSP
jgi:hypothetical protein